MDRKYVFEDFDQLLGGSFVKLNNLFRRFGAVFFLFLMGFWLNTPYLAPYAIATDDGDFMLLGKFAALLNMPPHQNSWANSGSGSSDSVWYRAICAVSGDLNP